MEQTAKIQCLSLQESKTWLTALAFVAGNILLPQLCHLIPQGGLILLPIYFFTLIGAYKYGIYVGLITAIVSPLANNLFFGMPPTGMLPFIITKSILLSVVAAWVANRRKDVSLRSLILVEIIYLIVSTLAEWGMTSSLQSALQDIRLGWPGLLLQVFGGYAVLRYLEKK